MRVVIFTIIPNLIDDICNYSIMQRSLEQEIWSLEVIDIRKYGKGKTNRVDDYSYGGGGMIMRPDVMERCIEDNINITNLKKKEVLFIHMSPKGQILTQALSQTISSSIKELYIICSRFEGIDQRIIEYYNITEISIGEYIMLGGEIASMAMLESIIRLLPNVVQNKQTLREESFSNEMADMVEYNQYTKPKIWKNIQVPHILQSGNHKEMQKWRLSNAKQNTAKYKEINLKADNLETTRRCKNGA